MAEYIEREKLLKRFNVDDMMNVNGTLISLRDAREKISNFPAADVAPVRHGKWMPFHAEFAGDIQYCSVCEIGFADRTAYCPHCGAVMDGWRMEGAENE